MKRRTGYLIRRGKYYYAVCTVDGKKIMETTGQTDRRKAETELHRIVEPYLAEDKKTVLENIATKIKGLDAIIAKHEEESNPPLKVADAWIAYKAEPNRPDTGDATMQVYAGQFAKFEDWLSVNHADIKAMRDVNTELAKEYAGHLTRLKIAPGTYNKHIRLLKLVFRVLKEKARLADNPWENITRKQNIQQTRRELTVDELAKVITTATGELRLLTAIGIYTGLRLGDAATLRWAETDLPRGMIRRVPSKTARHNQQPVTIPIHPQLFDLLSKIPRQDRGEYILPETARQYLQNPSGLTDRIQAHFVTCGIRTVKRGTGGDTGKRAVVEVGFHSLRHTFVSLCREANTPLSVVEAIVGHSNPAMTRHYTHVSELAATEAIKTLPSITGDKVKSLPPARMVNARDVEGLANKLTAKNWKTIKEKLLKLAGKE